MSGSAGSWSSIVVIGSTTDGKWLRAHDHEMHEVVETPDECGLDVASMAREYACEHVGDDREGEKPTVGQTTFRECGVRRRDWPSLPLRDGRVWVGHRFRPDDGTCDECGDLREAGYVRRKVYRLRQYVYPEVGHLGESDCAIPVCVHSSSDEMADEEIAPGH